MSNNQITRERISEVERAIRPFIRWTPVVRIDASDFGLPQANLALKLELLQHSGSFKVRGAFTNLLRRKVPQAGVVAASGGNHGVAVAYAAQRLGIRATIFLPSISSPAKIERMGQILWWRENAMPMRSPQASGMSPRAVQCQCTPMIRSRRCSDREPSDWNSRLTHPASTRCWSQSEAAG